MNIISIFEKFPTQEDCIGHLEHVRWGNTPSCPYCESGNTNPLKKELRHHCNGCRKSFSVTVGTIFHDTRIPLQKWFLAISLILNAKKGIASRQLARDLQVNKDTAWRIAMRISGAMADSGELLSGIIEMDECYIGGRPRKSNRRNGGPKNPRGRGTKKTPVVGMVQRNGKTRAKHVKKAELRATPINQLIRENIDVQSSVLVTDEYRGYLKADRLLKHYTINHSVCYADGEIHTNGIESFWALLKRGIIGQFHKVSVKHLDKYLNQFTFRHNARKEPVEMTFERVLRQAVV